MRKKVVSEKFPQKMYLLSNNLNKKTTKKEKKKKKQLVKISLENVQENFFVRILQKMYTLFN